MTPIEWEVAAGPEVPWQKAYRVIEGAARVYLATLPDGCTIRTNALVEALYPIATVRGKPVVRDRIYKALLAHSDGAPAILQDCRIRGPETRIYGGVKAKIWLWHRPKGHKICCPNCQFEWELS